MGKSEHSGLLKYLVDFPEQLDRSRNIVAKAGIQPLKLEKLNHIVVTGMGGSAIAADILGSFFKDELALPFIINRKENLPKYIAKDSLVIVSSYSGNTEETLLSFEEALQKKAHLLVITSGGKLKKLAIEKNIPLLEIPGDYPPRQALGFSFFSLLFQFNSWGWIKVSKNEIDDIKDTLHAILNRTNPNISSQKSLAFNIARTIYKKIPVIYTATDWLEPVLTRWRNQINENAKSLAFSNIIPEMNHNEITGWETTVPLDEHIVVIFLRDYHEESDRMKRLLLTRELIAKKCQNIIDVYPEGETRLGRLLSMIYLGDWVSCFLAKFYDQDPLSIKNIDYLKSQLIK